MSVQARAPELEQNNWEVRYFLRSTRRQHRFMSESLKGNQEEEEEEEEGGRQRRGGREDGNDDGRGR